MALAALATGVIGNVIYYCMLIGRGEMMKEYMASNANMNATIVEYVNGMEVIKAFKDVYKRQGHACGTVGNDVCGLWESRRLFHRAVNICFPSAERPFSTFP